ncbi:MAG: T9SS type A sorting domain-containing protein [Saprospirales bacterium]|nr:T9SS type A sorting domain-containing protein [Saprospirales bacterium]
MNGPFGAEITGPPSGGAGVAFDQLVVSAGTATVNGVINADFGTYTPTPGAMYQIIAAQAYAGSPTLSVTPNTITATYSNGVLTVVSCPPRHLALLPRRGGGERRRPPHLVHRLRIQQRRLRCAAERQWPRLGNHRLCSRHRHDERSANQAILILPCPLPTADCTLYYRLMQKDFDGTTDYSPIRVVELTGEAGGIRVFPNPASEKVTIAFAEPTAYRGSVQLLTQNNRLVAEYTIAPETTDYQVRVAQLPSGMYILNVKVGNKEWMKRLVVE